MTAEKLPEMNLEDASCDLHNLAVVIRAILNLLLDMPVVQGTETVEAVDQATSLAIMAEQFAIARADLHEAAAMEACCSANECGKAA